MAPREPAGERDVVCGLFIPLFVDYWKCWYQDSHFHIFGYASEEHTKVLCPFFLPLSFWKRRTEYWINCVYWNTSVSIIRRQALVCCRCSSNLSCSVFTSWLELKCQSLIATLLVKLLNYTLVFLLTQFLPEVGWREWKKEQAKLRALDIGNGILGSLSFKDWPVVIIFTKR